MIYNDEESFLSFYFWKDGKEMKTRKFFVAFFVTLMALFLICGAAAIAEARNFPAFSTTDINDRVVTNAIFAENDITMVYFWATWCPACVTGVQSLAEMLEATGGRGLVGILIDMENRGRAQQILNNAGAAFPQLSVSAEMETIMRSIQAVPTSIFVDSRGNIVGPTIVGARSSQYYLNAMQAAREEAR